MSSKQPDQKVEPPQAGQKEPYQPPELIEYGRVSEVTGFATGGIPDDTAEGSR
ncbi:MAG TPA: lasso RiPP family leader peptide-containing protein [Polyangiaceae bacterium]